MKTNDVAPFVAPEKETRHFWAATKLTKTEYDELLSFSGGRPIDSEWVRHALLTLARRVPTDRVVGLQARAVVGETLALRTLVINLLDHLVTRKPITDTTVRELVRYADDDKLTKATRLLATVSE